MAQLECKMARAGQEHSRTEQEQNSELSTESNAAFHYTSEIGVIVPF